MAQLIETIQVVAEARPAESVQIQVTLTEDAPADTQVLIFGLCARDVWLQAPGRLGKWEIPIIASSESGFDQRVVAVDVSGTPAAPVLELARNPFRPLSIVLRAADLDPTQPLLAAGDIYRWTIGGAAAVTGQPLLSQDVESHVDDRQAWTPLLIQLTVDHSDGTAHTAQRTLVLGSVYRFLRDVHDQVRPPVSTDGLAKQPRVFSPLYEGSFDVRNLEPAGLTFTLQRVEWLVTDDQLASYGPDKSINLRLEPGAASTVNIELDRREATPGAHGAIVHIFGQLDDGIPVHTSAAFDFVRSMRRFEIVEPDLVQNPSILDKVAHVLEVYGGDPYALGAMTGGLLRIKENVRSVGVTHEQLWALDLLTNGAPVRIKQQFHDAPVSDPAATVDDAPLAQKVTAIPRASGAHTMKLAGLAAAITAPDLRQIPDRVLDPQLASPAPPWLRSIRDRLGIQDRIEFLPDVGGVREGAECDPDNLPDEIPEFFACQFFGEYREDLVLGRAANARRGDIILVPGGNGLIGGLLAKLEPLQRYAHAGIMTKNFVEVSHSTASKDWLKAHARGVDPLGAAGEVQPTDGFEPDALRYQWPGGITQSIEAAYGGSEFTSPEGKPYRIAAFNLADKAFLDEQWQIIPPLVLKPHPSAEHDDPNLRKRLHLVANQARQLCVTEDDTKAGRQSKTHYRFYCYTDAALALRTEIVNGIVPVPSGESWPGGTIPTVCSSMIWLAARRAGEKLEGPGQITQPVDLEPFDVTAGAQTDPQTEDGLYFYTEKERAIAASWLVGYISDDIYKQEAKEGGWFGGALNEAFSDMADDCAYQITNTFAFDMADGTTAIDDDLWRNPGVGRAVSPDNLLLWDKPQETGRGLWGYFEPLDHHSARVEMVPVTKWRKTSGRGTLKGKVKFLGQPVANASVNVGGNLLTTSSQGDFSIVVLEGTYDVRASAFIDDAVGFVSTVVPLEVKIDQTTTADINLQVTPDKYRRVVIDAHISFRDDEFTLNPFDDDPDEYDEDGKLWQFDLQPWDTEKSTTYVHGWGGECRIEVRITAKLNFDRSVFVTISGDLFEGATENTSERDGQGSYTWHVLKDTTVTDPPLRITHDNEDDTYAEFRLKITNKTQ